MLTLASNVTRAIQASGAGALQSATTFSVPVGYAAGDVVQVTACSQAPANKIWLLVSLSGQNATVQDLSGGPAPVFVFAGNPTLTVSHIGFVTQSLTLDNTIFTAPNPDFTTFFRVEALTSATGIRAQWQDTADAFVNDIKPGGVHMLYGQETVARQYASFSQRRYDWQGARLGNANNAFRLVIYVEGQYGAAAPAGSSISYSAFVG